MRRLLGSCLVSKKVTLILLSSPLLVTFSASPAAASEAPETEWTRTCSLNGAQMSKADSVDQTSDGGYLIAGTVNIGGAFVLLVKNNELGDPDWEKTCCLYNTRQISAHAEGR